MIVTDKKYHLDDNYIKKLNLMIKRLKGTDDNVLPIDGDEGQGKTEFAVGTCYYIAYKTKRKYGVENIFFDLEEVIKFASSTEKQIIHFDEAVLGLLTTNWQDKIQKRFLQLIMIARKKRHFIVLCIPKFHRLSQYIIEERAIGLVHVYSKKNLEKGNFCYFTKDGKDKLYTDWKRKRIKTYKQHFSFKGKFVMTMEKVFTPEQVQAYEDKKDESILGFSAEKKTQGDRWREQRDNMIRGIKKDLKVSDKKMEEVLKKLNVDLKKSEISSICNNEYNPPPFKSFLL